jgi:hypothetical protein
MLGLLRSQEVRQIEDNVRRIIAESDSASSQARALRGASGVYLKGLGIVSGPYDAVSASSSGSASPSTEGFGIPGPPLPRPEPDKPTGVRDRLIDQEKRKKK